MNVLIVGGGKGSFQMRGVQVGAVLGARVVSDPTDADFGWADVVILLKRAILKVGPQAARARKPIIWDALDFWSQPAHNRYTVDQGVAMARQDSRGVPLAATIGATQAMADALGGVYIPHHCRLGLVQTPPRESVQVVAYDGSERYLGAWRPAIQTACEARGWSFVINPPDLSTADILVAFRDHPWDGTICRAWKSGVKYVNAITAGRPIITQDCAAVRELGIAGDGVPGAAIIEEPSELSGAFDAWVSLSDRQSASKPPYHSKAFTVENIVEQFYRPLLARVVSEVSCTA